MSASKITLQFNKAMASPTGKEAEFSTALAIISNYQQWDSYPPSPLLTVDYPYQVILFNSGQTRMICSTQPMFIYDDGVYGTVRFTDYADYSLRYLSATTWINTLTGTNYAPTQDFITLGLTTEFYEANNDVYNEIDKLTIYFSKTTIDTIALTIDSITQPTDTTYQVNIAETLTTSDVITCDYTKGTIKSSDGGALESFSTSVANGIT